MKILNFVLLSAFIGTAQIYGDDPNDTNEQIPCCPNQASLYYFPSGDYQDSEVVTETNLQDDVKSWPGKHEDSFFDELTGR